MSARRSLLRRFVTVSCPAGGAATIASIPVPAYTTYHVNKVNLTKGANTTLSAQKIDGLLTGQTASYDAQGIFGIPAPAETSIEITGSNAGAAAENLTIEIIGYSEGK